MADNKIFKEYYTKLLFEGLLKSLVCGLAIGFAVTFAAAIGVWFTTLPVFALVLIPVGSGLVVTAACTAAFYFYKFKPTTDKIAKRIDALGLEERLITMLELENDQSYIAMRQREDAKAKLSEVTSSTLKLKFSKLPVIAASITCALAITMTTVAGMSGTGLVKRGMDFVDDTFNDGETKYCTLSYEVVSVDQENKMVFDNGGLIDGEIEQIIAKGEDGTEVYAEPEEGYAFAAWVVYITDDEGNELESYQDEVNVEPARTDVKVMNNMKVVAVFQEVGEGDGNGGEGEEGDEPQDDDSQNSPSNSDKPQDGDPSDNNSGGSSDPINNDNILNNETYYKTVLGDYYDILMQYISEGKEIPDSLKKILEQYNIIIQ